MVYSRCFLGLQFFYLFSALVCYINFSPLMKNSNYQMFKYSYQAFYILYKVRGVTYLVKYQDSPKTLKERNTKVKTSIHRIFKNHPKYHQLQYSFCIYVFMRGRGYSEFKQVISDQVRLDTHSTIRIYFHHINFPLLELL